MPLNASLTHRSIGPSSFATRSAAARTWSRSATSVGDAEAAAAGCLDLLDGGVQAGLAAGEHGDVPAVCGQFAHDGPAHSGGPAGHDGDAMSDSYGAS